MLNLVIQLYIGKNFFAICVVKLDVYCSCKSQISVYCQYTYRASINPCVVPV